MSETPLPDSQAQAPSAGQGQQRTRTHSLRGSQRTKPETMPKSLQIQVTVESAEMTPSPRFGLLIASQNRSFRT